MLISPNRPDIGQPRSEPQSSDIIPLIRHRVRIYTQGKNQSVRTASKSSCRAFCFECEYLIMMTAQTALPFAVIFTAFHVRAANPLAFLFNFFVS